MSYVDDLKAIEHAKLRAARTAVEALRGGCEPVIRQVTDVYLATIPSSPLRDQVAEEIVDRLVVTVRDFCDYALRVIDFFVELVDWIGSPVALRAAADALLADVDGPANDLLLDIKQSALPGRLSWNDGKLSQNYGFAHQLQPQELERLFPFVESLRDVLRGMADSIENFHLELTVAIVGFTGAVAGVVVTVLEIAGVVTIPLAIATGVATILSAVAAVGAFVSLGVTTSQVQGGLLDAAESGFSHTWATPQGFATVE